MKKWTYLAIKKTKNRQPAINLRVNLVAIPHSFQIKTQAEVVLLIKGKEVMIVVVEVIQETDEVALKTRSFKNLAEL